MGLNTLEPHVNHFRIDYICQLINKLYPQNFIDLEKEQLEIELNHYKYNVVQHSNFQTLSNISDLCQWLVRTGKSTIYQLVFQAIVFILYLFLPQLQMSIFNHEYCHN
jgi:hypothetical protein